MKYRNPLHRLRKVKCKKKVAAILDAATEVGDFRHIARVAETSAHLVTCVLKDFPLWEFARQQLKDGRQ